MGDAVATFFESVGSFFSQIWFAITTISVFDILDIIIVAFIIYNLYFNSKGLFTRRKCWIFLRIVVGLC